MAFLQQGPPFLRPDESVPDISRYQRQELFELLVFLFLIVPAMVLSFFVVQQGGSFRLIAIATILRDLSLVCLIAFFLWRNRESKMDVGWTARTLASEVAIGVVLFFPLLVATNILDAFLRSIGLSGSPKDLGVLTPKGNTEIALAVVLVIVVAITEELIFRGYLILRFKALTRSPVAAVVLSSIIFSIGHGYEGTAGVITVGAMGAAFAVVYLWRRSLVAAIVMHFLQDFIAIIVLPLLPHK